MERGHSIGRLASLTDTELRHLAAVGGAAVSKVDPMRRTPIDTALLTAALMLLTMLPRAMFANGWLTMKLSLVVLYIVLGVFALNRAKTPRGRLLAYVAALATFATIVSIARSHQPLGWWWLLLH